jgi:hypothetical protein
MTAPITSAPQASAVDLDGPPSNWRARRQLARHLRQRDEASARLAELDRLAGILSDAADLIRMGWLQHSWFAYLDEHGRTRTVTAHNLTEMTGRPVVGACLVGAVVQAGGGLNQVRSQEVQRSLDVTWHTLFDSDTELSRWTPAPLIRMNHVQQLTRWNDHPRRTASQVEGLLRDSATAARSEAGRLQRSLELQH